MSKNFPDRKHLKKNSTKLNFFYSKKGFEMQFNWIFVLVAGAVILLFFAFIIVRQKDVSELSAKVTVLKSIGSIITSASVSTDTTGLKNIPNSNIEIGCNRVSLGSGASKQYQNLVLFAPNILKGSNLIWQTNSFSIPYRATNLLFLTNSQVRYIIIGDTPLAREVNKSLSSYLNKEFNPILTSIKNEGDSKVMFIIFNNMNPTTDFVSTIEKFKNIPDLDVTAIKIKGDSSLGETKFYRKKGNTFDAKEKSYYLTKPGLLGAIYSDSKEDYECGMKNVFSRLVFVNDIYASKLSELIINSKPICVDLFQKAKGQLRHIRDSFEEAISKEFNMEIFENIINYGQSLISYNKDLQKISCPSIY